MGIINRYACAVGLDDDDHKNQLVPQEDQGAIMVNMSIAPGSTLEENKLIMAKIEKILESTPEIEHYARIAGYGLISGQGASYGSVITD